MTALSAGAWSETDQEAIREQLSRILRSKPFAQSQRRQRFLEYLIAETLAGRAERLKGYSLGVEIFGRPDSFDPALDPVVRVEAGRLREKLHEYYGTEGLSDPIRIDLPKGTYAPQIAFRREVIEKPPASRHATLREKRAEVVKPLAGALILIALLVSFTVWGWLKPASHMPEKASIAVLPFTNIGSDPKWDRFADGVTEDIVTDLSHSKDLFVVARNSTAVYKGKPVDVRAVGRNLGVRYVLEGSIQPSGNQIRVTTQLIDARTGGHVWSNRYIRPARDLFEVQSDVTGKIAATLTGYEGAVAEAERSLIRRKPPSDLNAYQSYLLGMEAKHGGPAGSVTEKGLAEAEQLFKKAIDIDPQLARAYVGLAYIYEYRLEFGIGSAAENLARQIETARNAVRLDPGDGETQLVLGHALAYQLADQALEQFAKAEALAPNNADVLILIAWYLPQLNQPERAVALVERALQLNPNYPSWYNQGLRYVYFFGGQYEKSRKYSELVTEPFAADLAYLAAAAAMTGDIESAKASADDVERLDADWSVEQYLSDAGGFPEELAALFVAGARKAGVRACVPFDKVTTMPTLVQLETCKQERAHAPGP